MKNQIYKTAILVFLLISLKYSLSYSQAFYSATVTDNSAGVTVSPYNTGNDIYDDVGNSITYKVSVWSDAGTAPGIAWEVWNYSSGGTTYTGNRTFATTSDIYYTDVCIVHEGSNVYAIAVWHAGGTTNAWYSECFLWSGTAFGSLSTGFLMSGTFGTTINIDGDDASLGHVAIVFDDNNQNIYGIVGYVSSGAVYLYDGAGPAVLDINYSSNPLALSYTGMYPDVSLYRPSIGTSTLHVAYIKGNGDLDVQDHSYSTLAGYSNTSSNPTNFSPATPTYTFSYPRIACPDRNGSVNSWTVVVAESDHSSNYLIEGFNDFGTSNSGPIIYNDGTTGNSPCDITGIPNHLPVVAYDNQNLPNVWIGWIMNNAGNTSACTGVIDAEYPIVVKCDKLAQILSGSPHYLTVPNAVVSTDIIIPLSLASRYAADSLYLTYHNVNTFYDINTKCVQSTTSTQLRTGNSNDINQFFAEAENNLLRSSSQLTVSLFDLNGNLILSKKGTFDKIRKALQKNTETIRASVYLARIVSDDGKYYLSKKVFLGN